MWRWEEHNAFSDSKGSIKQWFEDKDLVQMQFIGLKDKNGKEIYDGDIYNEHGYRWIVAWDPRGGWAIKAEKGMNNEPFERNAFVQDNALKGGEVIGNIYENPELLHVQEESQA
jgi:uncharacterized phage protein (TIGR01671 family)